MRNKKLREELIAYDTDGTENDASKIFFAAGTYVRVLT
jgi:hypothetical protein